MLEIAFRPDRQTAEPLYRQLEHYLRGLIEADRLPPETKLPASRELAAALGLARVTVVTAYERLTRDGLLTSHVGQGSFVAARAVASPPGPRSTSRSFVWEGLFAQRARLLELPAGMAIRASGDGPRYDFRGGQVDVDSLPLAALRRALASAIRRHGAELAGPPGGYGWLPLRREIARLLVSRGIECEPGEVAVVSGAQQVVDLVARVLVDPGDTVVVEQPGYFGAALAFRAAQANLVGVSVDGDGLSTVELERVLRVRRVKLVYATPGSQSPTGVVMSETRRREFLTLADEHQTPILEDDYAAELRYRAPAVSALKALDHAGQVIYAGTFSKVLFPSFRIGFVVAAEPLLRKMALARWNADGGAPLLAEIALTTLVRSGELERHLRRLRKLYAARLASLLEALGAAMPPGVEWREPSAGHGVWLTLPREIDGEALCRDAAAEGILYTRGNAFHLDGEGSSYCDLSFARLSQSMIVEGIERFAAIVRRHLRGAGLARRARRVGGANHKRPAGGLRVANR